MTRLYLFAATLNAWVLIAILAAAFVVQFALGELPCPLCVLQRVGLMLCALGPLRLLIRNSRDLLDDRDIAISCGMSVIAGLLGAAMATRQVLLHILPGDPGYGAPVFGIHLYTWCLVAFVAHALAAGVMLTAVAWVRTPIAEQWRATPPTVVAFGIVVLGNLLAVIAEAGPHWNLPPDPQRYLLFG